MTFLFNAKPHHGQVRLLLQRGLAFIYGIAFLIAFNQFSPLAGPEGILPMHLFLQEASWKTAPSLFLWNASPVFILSVCGAGIFLAVIALTGLSEKAGIWFSAGIWASLWMLYLSIVNAGQTFYGFGWETLLLECGFLAIFLGSEKTEPPVIVIWLYRWVIFRIMFGAGLIKLRGDGCWRDLTCMDYHYETQPLPNPLSWYLHHLPSGWHKLEVLFTHFMELPLPFLYFIPGLIGGLAGVLTVFFHGILILSGNLSWLNYITIVASFSCFDKRVLGLFFRGQNPAWKPAGTARRVLLFSLLSLIAFKSIEPAVNLVSPRQKMNASFDPLHLVNTYGAFGGITRRRFELVIEGTESPILGSNIEWKEYEFKCKPGDVKRAPCVISPYHYKIDWQMWFAAMNDFRYHPWIFNLIAKLLAHDVPVRKLLEVNPFEEKAPEFIRVKRYYYRFSTPEEKRATGHWWVREPAGEYLPPLSRDHPALKQVLLGLGFERLSKKKALSVEENN